MSWAKIDDMFSQHPKLIQAGAVAWGMWAEGIAYCNRNLTDGFIPESAAEAFGGRWRVRQGGKTWEIFARCGDEVVPVTADWIAVALVDAGLWHQVEGGYQVHDYLDYQPSRAQVLAKREELSAIRREAGAAGGRAKAANARQPASNGHGKEDGNTSSKSSSKPLANGYQKRSPMPVPVPVTTDAADAAATRADAPERGPARDARPRTDPRSVEVFRYWVTVTRPRPPADNMEGDPGQKRLATVSKLLTAKAPYGVDQLKAAVDGCWGDDWHREKCKTDLTYILRADKVDEFIAKASAPNVSRKGKPYLDPGPGMKGNKAEPRGDESDLF